jgi:ATP/maltotriose-dependent transcriptional regulator MalT
VGLALERCDAVANRLGASRKVQAFVAMQRGVLQAMQGDVARGRQSVAHARRELEELGQSLYAIGGAREAADVEMMAQDPQAAETLLRSGLGGYEDLGEQAAYSTQAGYLAHALYNQGRLDEAEAFVTLCRETAPADDVMSQMLWRSALAMIAARKGTIRRRSSSQKTRGP